LELELDRTWQRYANCNNATAAHLRDLPGLDIQVLARALKKQYLRAMHGTVVSAAPTKMTLSGEESVPIAFAEREANVTFRRAPLG
jgi:hypothetical protein